MATSAYIIESGDMCLIWVVKEFIYELIYYWKFVANLIIPKCMEC